MPTTYATELKVTPAQRKNAAVMAAREEARIALAEQDAAIAAANAREKRGDISKKERARLVGQAAQAFARIQVAFSAAAKAAVKAARKTPTEDPLYEVTAYFALDGNEYMRRPVHLKLPEKLIRKTVTADELIASDFITRVAQLGKANPHLQGGTDAFINMWNNTKSGLGWVRLDKGGRVKAVEYIPPPERRVKADEPLLPVTEGLIRLERVVEDGELTFRRVEVQANDAEANSDCYPRAMLTMLAQKYGGKKTRMSLGGIEERLGRSMTERTAKVP